MHIRKITSLTALLSFLFMLSTSIILFVAPQGRVAYWSDWHFWGVTKTQWGNIHINLGILFILSILLHIYYNWNAIIHYLKNRQKSFKIFTLDFNISLAITVVFALGTYLVIPPFSNMLNLGEKIKNHAAVLYGEPPFGHAEEASLASLVKKMGLDLQESIARLEAAGIKIDSTAQVFLDIAKKHRMTPKAVYDIILPAQTNAGKKTIPAIPAPGTGNKTLMQVCSEYQLNYETTSKALESMGVEIIPEQTIKGLASANDRTSVQLYDMIKEISEREVK